MHWNSMTLMTLEGRGCRGARQAAWKTLCLLLEPLLHRRRACAESRALRMEYGELRACGVRSFSRVDIAHAHRRPSTWYLEGVNDIFFALISKEKALSMALIAGGGASKRHARCLLQGDVPPSREGIFAPSAGMRLYRFWFILDRRCAARRALVISTRLQH